LKYSQDKNTAGNISLLQAGGMCVIEVFGSLFTFIMWDRAQVFNARLQQA
jgi:hypothetical protein